MVHIVQGIHDCNFVMTDGDPTNAKCIVCGKSILDDVVLPPPKEEKELQFMKYPSIKNTYRVKTIQEIENQGLNNGVWVATNKLHGANFQVCADAEKVKFAKRTSFIEDDENFYGLHSNLYNMKLFLIDRIKRMQNYFGETLNVFFEIYGGSYPHPDVKKFPVSRIQKGVCYTPSVDIRVIDVAVDFEFLPFDEMTAIVKHYNLKPAIELHRGSFKEMIELDPVFEDPTYKEYNLPSLENNYSEGLVIRPVEEKKFGNGSRVILKKKNPKFSEKQRTPKVHKQPLVLAENVKEIYEELSQSITENRLRNILSHGEEITNKDFGKLQGMLVQDVLKEDGECLETLEKDERKQVNKLLSQDAAELIRENFLNILDKTF